MKFMIKYLLLFTLFFGTLSFTSISFSHSVDSDGIESAWNITASDSISPTNIQNGLAKPATHTVLSKENKLRKLKPAHTPPAPEFLETTALVSVNAVAVCKGNGYFAGGRPRFVSGVFRDTLSSFMGRDSIVVTELSILPCKLSE